MRKVLPCLEGGGVQKVLDPQFSHFVAPVREFGNFAKTQGIWFAQLVNSVIIKVKYISIFAAKASNFIFKLDKFAKSVLCM